MPRVSTSKPESPFLILPLMPLTFPLSYSPLIDTPAHPHLAPTPLWLQYLKELPLLDAILARSKAGSAGL